MFILLYVVRYLEFQRFAKNLISRLAPTSVGAFLTEIGALFQSFAQSMPMLSRAALVKAKSFHFFVVVALTVWLLSILFGLHSSN